MSLPVPEDLLLIDAAIGAQLRAKRFERGMTQQALGERIGVRMQQVSKYELGVDRISAALLWKICRALETPAAYFYERLIR